MVNVTIDNTPVSQELGIEFVANFDATQNNTRGCRGIFLRPDESQLFHIDDDNDIIREYSLSTSGDLTTASYTIGYIPPNATNLRGLTFGDGGTKMYHCAAFSDEVYEYTLSTAWDVSSASEVGSVTVAAESPYGCHINSDGTKFYIAYLDSDEIIEYDLSTAYDISTISSAVNTLPTNEQVLFIDMNDAGDRLIANVSGNYFKFYSLGTAEDLSTAVNLGRYRDDNIFSGGAAFGKSDGLTAYGGNFNGFISQHELSAEYGPTVEVPGGETWDVTLRNAEGGDIDAIVNDYTKLTTSKDIELVLTGGDTVGVTSGKAILTGFKV